MAPDRSTHYHTMISPNSNALMNMLANAARHDAKPTAAGFQMIYVGKDKYPLSILSMTPITSEEWRKGSSFESLASTMCGQLDVHDTADLISVISSEIPIDVTSTFMEANRVNEAVIASLNHVSNLLAIFFLYSSGNSTKNSASINLKDRIADIVYIKFS